MGGRLDPTHSVNNSGKRSIRFAARDFRRLNQCHPFSIST